MKYLINFMMVFLKHIKTSYTRRKIENSKRNGLRHTIFSPRSKSYYIGEWKNDIKEGRGREVNRYINYCVDKYNNYIITINKTKIN